MSRSSANAAVPSLRDRISTHVAAQITSSRLAVGARVPSESELMAQFGASRMTVHHALRDLTAWGLLRRHKGLGSFVAETRPYVAIYDHRDVVSEIELSGARHSARVIRQVLRPATAHEAAEFVLARGEPLFHAVVVHRANGVPLELEDRLLNPSILPGCMEVDLEKRSLFSLLLDSRPYREGSETVRAILASGKDRSLLELGANEACLEIERRTWSPAGLVTRARLLRAGAAAVMQGRIESTPRAQDMPAWRQVQRVAKPATSRKTQGKSGKLPNSRSMGKRPRD